MAEEAFGGALLPAREPGSAPLPADRRRGALDLHHRSQGRAARRAGGRLFGNGLSQDGRSAARRGALSPLQRPIAASIASMLVNFSRGAPSIAAWTSASSIRSEEHTSELQSLMRIS